MPVRGIKRIAGNVSGASNVLPEMSAETCVRDEPRSYSRGSNIYRDAIRCEAILGYFDESDIDIIGVKGIPKEKSQTAPVGAFECFAG